MKRIAELKAKNASIRNEISTPVPNLTRSTSPESTMNSKGMYRTFFYLKIKHIR